MKKRIYIIGAGPAGITAGCEILKNTREYEVIILEEENTVGGISKTINFDGNRMDLGGHRFFSKNKEVMNWWLDLLPAQGQPSYDDKILGRESELEEGGPDPEQQNKVFLKRHRVSRIYYNHKFFDYPVKMNYTTIKNLGIGTTMEAGFSYLRTVFYKRKEQSLEDFYINRFGKKLYSIFFEGYTEKLWGRHPRNISPDWGAQRVKGLSIKAVLKDCISKMLPGKNKEVETSLIEAFYYPKYGPGQLWEEAVSKFEAMGGIIKKGCVVKGVSLKDKKVSKILFQQEGQDMCEEADVIFSSMPLKNLIPSIEGVPKDVKEVAEGLPYRDFVTVGLVVKNLKLKNETSIKTLGGIVPDCWIYVQDKGVRMGRIQIFNNWSPYMVKNPEETVSLGLEYFCSEGDEMWTMTNEQWKDFGQEELVKMGVLDKDAVILDYHCEKVKKAYPAYFDTYKDIKKTENWINSIDNLYCIGRNGQHRYNNMDHSMLTAMEAVKVLLSDSKNKDVIWNVNTEKEYHEERKGEQ